MSNKINDKETLKFKKNLMIIKDKVLLIRNMGFELKKVYEENINNLTNIKITSLRKKIEDTIKEVCLTIKKSKKIINNILKSSE